MFNAFRAYLSEKTTLTAEEFNQLETTSIQRQFKRRQFLLHEGEVWQSYAFVVKGCFRTYHVDLKGEEHIMRFSVENWWVGDSESLITGKPSVYNIDALEDAAILLWPRGLFETLRKNIPALKEFTDQLMSRSFVAGEHRIHAAITYTAEERYQDFLSKYPDISQRVPLHMIASYLGISPVTLSRIRSQAAKKP